MTKTSLTLFRHQSASINTLLHHPEIPNVFLIAGYGSGKSTTDTYLLLYLYNRYKNSPEPVTIGVFGVTIKLLRQTVLKDMFFFFDRIKIPYKHNSQEGTIKVGSVTFVYLAMQEPDLIYAHNFHCAIIDEIDELPPAKVKAVVVAVQERCRKVMPPLADNLSPRDPFLFFTTTAQGMRGTYQLLRYFDQQDIPYAVIRGRTQDNTSLAKTQLEMLRKLYTPEEQKAFLDGEFVNLTNGRVYWAFNRKEHMCMRFREREDDTIYVGQDFNALHNASAECVVRGGHIYVLNSHHFNDLGCACRELRVMYPTNRIVLIPDASGKEIARGFMAEVEANDIELFWNSHNPSITERIMVINKALMWGQLKLMQGMPDERNSLQEHLITCMETRDFDDNTGKPRKIYGENGDHQNDALEYAVWHIIHSLQGFDDLLTVLRMSSSWGRATETESEAEM